MSFMSLTLKPGVNTQLTPALLGEGYSSSQLVRFMFGQPQKLGGWQRLTSTPLVGICRGMKAFSDLYGNAYLACGTDQRLQLYYSGAIYDITPVRLTDNVVVNFSTTSGSAIVTIVDTGSAVITGDWVNIFVPVSVGGIILQGLYLVTAVDTNTYTVTATAPATSNVMNGGAVPFYTATNTSADLKVTFNNHGLIAGGTWTVHVAVTVGGFTLAANTVYSVASVIDANNFNIQPGGTATSNDMQAENGNLAQFIYLIHSGFPEDVPSTGAYGTGVYGAGIYGSGASGALVLPARQWFLDSWGQTLIGNYTNGPSYTWTPPDVTVPAAIIATAPQYATCSLVISQAQIYVTFGAESGGTQYPNLIRWSDVSDYTDFTPTAVNQAGSFQIPTGSKIVAALVIGLTCLIWTDTDLYSMTYQGLPFVFDFQRVGSNCEAISARSVGQIGQRIIWPSVRGFYQFDGASVTPLPCPVWDYFFDNWDQSEADQVFCATNTLFTEFTWYFPLMNAEDNDNPEVPDPMGYVKFNTLESTWDIGTLIRTAWTDHSPVGNPIGVDQNYLLQQHEVTNDADGVAMVSSITSGYMMLGDGENFLFVDAIWPDILTQGTTPTLTIMLTSLNEPNGQVFTYGPYTFSPASEFVSVRVRGRYLSYTIQSSDLGSFWRIGRPLIRIAPAGRR